MRYLTRLLFRFGLRSAGNWRQWIAISAATTASSWTPTRSERASTTASPSPPQVSKESVSGVLGPDGWRCFGTVTIRTRPQWQIQMGIPVAKGQGSTKCFKIFNFQHKEVVRQKLQLGPQEPNFRHFGWERKFVFQRGALSSKLSNFLLFPLQCAHRCRTGFSRFSGCTAWRLYRRWNPTRKPSTCRSLQPGWPFSLTRNWSMKYSCGRSTVKRCSTSSGTTAGRESITCMIQRKVIALSDIYFEKTFISSHIASHLCVAHACYVKQRWMLLFEWSHPFSLYIYNGEYSCDITREPLWCDASFLISSLMTCWK